MTTTVGMLLDDVHTRAWDLCAELEDRRAENRYGERGLEVLAVWPRLATAALRVLDAVPLEPAWLDDMGSVRLVLGQVGRGVLEATADNGSAAASLKPDPAVGELARRLGLIADLLGGEKPARTDVDRAALEGLQANVVSIVHAVAGVPATPAGPGPSAGASIGAGCCQGPHGTVRDDPRGTTERPLRGRGRGHVEVVGRCDLDLGARHGRHPELAPGGEPGGPPGRRG